MGDNLFILVRFLHHSNSSNDIFNREKIASQLGHKNNSNSSNDIFNLTKN